MSQEYMNSNQISENLFIISLLTVDNEIHLYIMLTMNFLILFCVQIEVRRVKRS